MDPSVLHMRTVVNGEERQSTPIADLCFDVPNLISFLSNGTTLEAGTIIMTGTESESSCFGIVSNNDLLL